MEAREVLESAADEAVDMDRLLPGEQRDIGSPHIDDAEHWASVYSQLIAFKVDIRQRTEAALKTIHVGARPEVQNDLLIMLAEEVRLVRRHEFWSQRVKDLRESAQRREEPLVDG